MSAIISDAQKKFIEQVATSEGFEHFKVNYNQGSLKGDGYMGTITVVVIEETKTKKLLHLILKSAHQGEELRKKTPIHCAYERENYMYGVVFNEFNELQKEYKVQQTFDATAKYYGGLNELNEECLALENLKEIGFNLWDRKKPMDSHHVGAVMAQYGKMHALSHALKKLKPEKYAEITKNLTNIFEGRVSDQEMKDSTVSVMDRAFKAVAGKMDAVAGLKRFLETSHVFFKQTLKIKNKYSVIMHGDCWCNNMMFKYEATSSQKPSKVYLLDWQLSSVGSPIQDISYFFYACSSKLCMDNFNSYLKIYHDSLTEMLKQLGLKAEEIMTFKELQTQWRIYAKYGMYMALMIIRIMLTEQQEAPDLRDLTKGGSMMELFDVDISNNDEYNKRVSIVISHMVKNRFI